eukprot:Seg883.6 transcript_id=Seg883.6/GoldUCD/mRNA.D3Y31 product="hypothetical protein" protein_id=Seg883.6/GoldUCD/D3Y31
MEEELALAKAKLLRLEAENERLRQVQSTKPKMKVPTKVLKVAFEMCDGLCEEVGQVEWSKLTMERKKELAAITANELKARGINVPDAQGFNESLRNYYNNKRKQFKIKSNPTARRIARKRSHLGVLNHRMRNNAVKEAVREKSLDTSNEEEVKQFRKSVKGLKANEIATPPNSDDEEGRQEQQNRKLEALRRGLQERSLLYARLREEIYDGTQNSTSQLSACSQNEVADTTCIKPEEYRDWLNVPVSGEWPWDALPAMSFQMINEVLEQENFHAAFGGSSAEDLKSLLPGSSIKAKLMYTLMKSAVECINEIETEYELAKVLMPISSSSISPNSKGGFDIKDQAAKYVADMGSETQSNIQNRYLVLPVLKTLARGNWKVKYWCVAVVIMDKESQRMLFLNPLGDKGDLDAKKMCYYFDKVGKMKGRWKILTNNSFEAKLKVKLPVASITADTGVFSFLYALTVMSSMAFPHELDIPGIRMWMLNTILKEGNFNRNDDLEADTDDDDETQFP